MHLFSFSNNFLTFLQKNGYDRTQQNNIALQIAQQYLNVMLNREIKKISESAMDNAQKLYDRRAPPPLNQK